MAESTVRSCTVAIGAESFSSNTSDQETQSFTLAHHQLSLIVKVLHHSKGV